MEIAIYTDGGSLNNPGPAASAFLIYKGKDKTGELVYKEGKAIGVATNNVAEYTALVNALTKLHELIKSGDLEKPAKVTVISDSELMVKQINGLYKVKHADMRDLLFQVRICEGDLNLPIVYTNVLRDKNADADALVKQALGR